MDYKFPQAWFMGLDEEKKTSFINLLQNNSVLINRFLQLLDGYIRQVESEELSDEHFNRPEWPVRQAFLSGRKRQLRDIKRLFSYME